VDDDRDGRSHASVSTLLTTTVRTRSLSPTIVVAIVAFSTLAVYVTSLSLHTIDVDTKAVAAVESLKQYRDTLSGTRGFPYQWRLLGTYLVYGGERITGASPHAVDFVVKTALLSLSSMVLFAFGCGYLSEAGAAAATALYLLLSVVAFADEPYSIYFTNDYLMLACWFSAVYMIRANRWGRAAALTFVAAWARETIVVVPVFAALRWMRGRTGVRPLVLTAAAFIVPTVLLRQIYRAPVGDWAWWRMVYVNVPFLQDSWPAFLMTVRYNVKVALFFNVLWLLAARRVIRTRDPFLQDLAVTCVIYVLLAYPVIYIRELRHFLPLAILVLPAGVAELDRPHADAGPERPRER